MRRGHPSSKKASLAKGRKFREDRPPPVREREVSTVGLPPPSQEKETVTVGAQYTVAESTRIPLQCELPAWEGDKEIVTVGL